MKVYSSELFYLIKSLTKSEKIYFRKYCKAFVPNGLKGYMLLFDYVNKLKIYDESVVQQHFKNSEVGKHLSVKKNYLQGVIYKALNSYYAGLSNEIQVRNLLNLADILHYKNLKKQSDYCLQRASKISARYDMDTYSMEIEKIEISKAILFRDLKKISQLQTQTNQQHYQRHLNSLEKSFKVRLIMLQIIFDFQQSGKLFKHSHRYEEYENILKPALKEIVSPGEKTFCLQALSLLYQNTGRHAEAVKTREEQLRIFTSNPDLKHVFPARYLACLNDISQQYKQLYRYKECLHAVKLCLAEIEQLPFGRSKYFQLNYKLHSYQILLDLYQTAGLYVQALNLINTIETMIKKNASEVSAEFRLVLNLQFASVNFVAGNYSNCQRYIHAIFNDNTKVRKDVHVSASILNVLCQFEQNEYDYQNYLVHYYSKKYKSRSPRYSFYPKVINSIGKALNGIVTNKRKDKNHLHTLVNIFMEVESDPSKNHILQGFDFISWVESKIKNDMLSNVIQTKNKRLVSVLKEIDLK